MGNLAYCRFENTYQDLEECFEVLYDKPINELSESEQKYAKRLIKMCEKISEQFINEVEE